MRTRTLFAAGAAVVALAAPATASAADPWLAEPSDTEGVYIITGSGPPNTRVDLVRVGSTWVRPHYFDTTVNEGEYTSPSGQFRVDEGFCNPGADCDGGDEDPFQLVFYGGPSVLPLWGSGSLFRSEAQRLELPEVEDVARTARVFMGASGPGSLPGYTTISGTTRIVPAGGGASVPLAGVLVDAFSASGRGSDELYGSGGEYSARTYSTADGSWSMKVPPGSWALRYRTQFDEPFYPGYVWNGCVIEPSHIPPPGTLPPAGTAYVTTPASGVELTVGANGVCNGSAPGGGGGGPSDGGGGPSGGGNPTGGGGGAPTGAAGPATVSTAKASTGSDGAVTLTVTVSGPGGVTATATTTAPKGGAKQSAAKKVTVAKASARAGKAGPVKLVLKLTKAGRALVAQRGKLTAKTAIVFKPASGATATTAKSVTFKKKPRPKRRSRR